MRKCMAEIAGFLPEFSSNQATFSSMGEKKPLIFVFSRTKMKIALQVFVAAPSFFG